MNSISHERWTDDRPTTVKENALVVSVIKESHEQSFHRVILLFHSISLISVGVFLHLCHVRVLG